MLLSAVARTGQSFGAAHIIDILRGAKTAKIEERGHDSLPTFGVGAGHDKPFWQAFIRQAVAGGYLSINIEGYGGLVLTRKGDAVLKGEESFTYREIPKTAKSARSERRSKVEMDTSDIDGDLLASLKALRRDLAAERNVPAYIVFGDATLIDMCRMRPETLDQMSLVNGVGPKKLQDFGPAFLRALAAGAA